MSEPRPVSVSDGVALTKAESGIPELSLEPGEFLIAACRPGVHLWVIIVLFAIPVVTLPLSIWLFLRSGKQYVVTNRRSVKIKRNGQVEALSHESLAEVQVKDMIPTPTLGNPQFPDTLKLVPTKESGQKPLVFANCGRFGNNGFTRLWGTLHYWVRDSRLPVEDAPAVDAEGELLDTTVNLNVLLIPNTSGLSGDKGVLVATDQGLRFVREGTDDSSLVRADFPAYAYLVNLARKCSTPDELDALLDQSPHRELCHTGFFVNWGAMKNAKVSMGSLTFKAEQLWVVSVPKEHREALKTRLDANGVS